MYICLVCHVMYTYLLHAKMFCSKHLACNLNRRDEAYCIFKKNMSQYDFKLNRKPKQ